MTHLVIDPQTGQWYPQIPMSYTAAPSDLLMQLAKDMILKGWQPVWVIVHQNGKFNPIPGQTGKEAPFPTVLPQPPGQHRLGFRPPHDVVIIDIDHYDNKRGADTIDAAEAWLGELPPTWKVTSRGFDNPSGRYLFRKPADLTFVDRSFAQFWPDPAISQPGLDVLSTGWRYSWAPGDINHKTGQTVQCFDPDGDICLLPAVHELPELPARWVEYFRNPPAPPHSVNAYQRPADGPQWWLQQPDASLGSRTELCGFAFDLLQSRLTPDEALVQLRRVALALDPSRPWEDDHLTGMVDGNTERKVDEVLVREEADTAIAAELAGGEAALAKKYQDALDAMNNKAALRIDPEVPYNEKILYDAAQQAGICLDEDEFEDSYIPTTEQRIQRLPEYDRLLWTELARGQARKDAAKILQGQFTGYEYIAHLPPPPEPTMLTVIGKNTKNTVVIGEHTVTVLSGHRSAGKTWAAAKWAAQEITKGNHVFWLDFERQAALFNQKLQALGINPAQIEGHVHYTSLLPAADRLCTDITQYRAAGRACLVVIDAFRGLQSIVAPGTTAIDGDAVEAVYQEYVNPVVEAGGTVALLDHMPAAGGKTFGSERKESAADYVILVEQVVPFTKTSPGFSTMTLTKDRYGVTEAGTVVGHLWHPGDGSKSGTGIDAYPDVPEFRSWAPENTGIGLDAVSSSPKQVKAMAVLDVVGANRLRYGLGELARVMHDVEPELFKTEETGKNFIRRMRSEGQLTTDSANKYDLPSSVTEVHTPSVTPGDLQYSEE